MQFHAPTIGSVKTGTLCCSSCASCALTMYAIGSSGNTPPRVTATTRFLTEKRVVLGMWPRTPMWKDDKPSAVVRGPCVERATGSFRLWELILADIAEAKFIEAPVS